MTLKARPYSMRLVLLVGIAMAVIFTSLSLFFLYLQASRSAHRIAGEVVSVEAGGRVILKDARGVEFVLIVPPEARLKGVETLGDLEPGEHVMSRADKQGEGVFLSDGLRVIEGFERK